MSNYLLAGGGTAGHVNPMLAVADRLRTEQPDATIVVVGTAEGLEARLVPERGYELVAIPKVPFPRRPNRNALAFVPRMRRAQAIVAELIRERAIDVVVGFGGYVSTPVYLAARAAGVPIVIHEANARPGLANRLGARFTRHVGVAFAGTPLPHARLVGMPLRPEIEAIASSAERRQQLRREAADAFGLDPNRPTLLVTGGSLGADRINRAVRAWAPELIATGWQIIHLVGGSPAIDDPELPGYRQLRYLDRMELALAIADAAVSRAGSSTVSELSALGIPTIYVPYAVGNGEQRLNAAESIRAGRAVLVADADFDADWLRVNALELLSDDDQLARMRRASGSVDGTAATVNLIHSALA